MTLITTQNAGYLDDPYLTEPYLGGSSFGNSGLQFLAVIEALHEEGLQFQPFIGTEFYQGAQFHGIIDAQYPAGLQFHGIIDALHEEGLQYQGVIEAPLAQGAQFHGIIEAQRALGAQFLALLATSDIEGLQFQAVVLDDRALGIEFRADQTIAHFSECQGETGYLEESYLSGPYLVATSCAHMGIQFRSFVNAERATGLQFRGIIQDDKTHGLQARLVINATDAFGVQFDAVKSREAGLQFNVVLYNTDNLRILCDFPSRGTSGENWDSNSIEPGDFDPNNLNTDIVEQVTRTALGTTTGWQLTCDTEVPQGIFLDTLAILNHNLTTSATVTLVGSNDPLFGTIGVSIPLEVRNDENIYYIAADFPTQGFRYWRFFIDDVLTHPDGFLQIGTIIFGAATIFQGECFVDEVDYGFKDFADTVRTAGHTNVSNSRALKKFLGLEFRLLNFSRTNFRQMRELFKDDRTVFKCLWIPTPDPNEQEYTARFAVFGKLVTIPRERHKTISRDADYVSFPIEVDESL